MAPSFWQLARKPKWVLGFLAAMLVAAIFAILMQWQLSRTFNVVGVEPQENSPVPIESLISPGPITTNVYDRLATARVTLDPENAYVVSDRLQLRGSETVAGYWVIANSFQGETSLTLALGFTESLELASSIAANLEPQEVSVLGFIEPTEPPQSIENGVLQSLSLAQLVNLYSSSEVVSYPAYLLVQQGVDLGLETISIEIRQQEIEINWLTAFYAVEWAFFALAAFYIWWRLVRDEQLRLQEELQ